MTSTDKGTRTVELAYPLDVDGTRHEPDSTVELPAEKARLLVQDGRARWADNTPAQPGPAEAKPAAGPAPTPTRPAEATAAPTATTEGK